jgi:hypothetical protein
MRDEQHLNTLFTGGIAAAVRLIALDVQASAFLSLPKKFGCGFIVGHASVDEAGRQLLAGALSS